MDLLLEFWEFVRHSKRFWLLPILIMLAMLAGVIVFTESSAVMPFIYALF